MVLAAVGVLSGVGVVLVGLLYRPLPHPAEADSGQVIRWLVTRDLSRESPEIRRALVVRLEELGRQSDRPVDWGKADERLNDTYRRRLFSNVPLLLEVWLAMKCEGYHALAPTQRPAYADRLLDAIDSWRAIDTLRPKSADMLAPAAAVPSVDAPPDRFVDLFFRTLQQWRAQAEPQQRRRIDEFLLTVQTRWFLRQFHGWWDGKSDNRGSSDRSA